MIMVGLTGGIGSGKSTAATALADLGAVVVDADRLARQVLEPGSEGLAEVVERFGDVLSADGSLDRAALGAKVFGDDGARRDLEAITHPRIRALTRERVAAAPEDAVVVHDVPLLVEQAMGPAYHLVVVVDTDEATRLDRLVRLRGMDEGDARRRIAAQATDGQRRAAADVLLDNGGAPEALVAAVADLWHRRLLPFEANVRQGVAADHPAPAGPVDPDPIRPGSDARLLARLRHVGGDLVVAVAPGDLTGGEGVIDLDVLVPTADRVDDPGLVGALTAAGFPRLGHGEHGSSDPGRAVHLHVRPV